MKARNAASISEHNKDVYIRSLQYKEIPPEQFDNLLKKYQIMEFKSRSKTASIMKKCKEKRHDYLEHVYKVKSIKRTSEEVEKRRIDEIMDTIIYKEQRANQSKTQFIKEMTNGKIEKNSKRMNDAKEVRLQIENEIIERRNSYEKIELNKAKTTKEKDREEYLKLVRKEIALKLSESERIENLDNPYIIAEMNAIKNYKES